MRQAKLDASSVMVGVVLVVLLLLLRILWNWTDRPDVGIEVVT